MKYIKPSIVSIKDEQLREYIASASTVFHLRYFIIDRFH